jgi:hypothetical protein
VGVAACERISDIRRLPFKPGESIEDPAYQELLDAGADAIPCLIERVTDTTRTADPRGIPGPHDTRIGDVAYFVLVRISGLEFAELLPARVRAQYASEGVTAYHQFVQRRANRVWLQKRLWAWYGARRE